VWPSRSATCDSKNLVRASISSILLDCRILAGRGKARLGKWTGCSNESFSCPGPTLPAYASSLKASTSMCPERRWDKLQALYRMALTSSHIRAR
jgi:hypothetical protein